MKARDLLFITIMLVVIGGLYYLSTKGKARAVPSSPSEHLTAKTREQCLVCHTSEKMAALEQAHKHPGKWRDARVSCFRCHAAASAQTAFINQAEMIQFARSFGQKEKLWLKPKRNQALNQRFTRTTSMGVGLSQKAAQ